MELTTRNIIKGRIEVALALQTNYTNEIKAGYTDKKSKKTFNYGIANTEIDATKEVVSIVDIDGELVELPIAEFTALSKRVKEALHKLDTKKAEMLRAINKCHSYEALKELIKDA